MSNKVNKLWVVKIGSSSLTSNNEGLNLAMMSQWTSQIVELRKHGIKVILVSSGSVALGMLRLNWHKRPHEIYKQQAAAAIGQSGLIQAYESLFAKHNVNIAQVLLTHDDIANRKRYLNAKSAINTLLDLNVVPIVNENDTVAIDEIKFGDNDSLAALVVDLIAAQMLVILTDQDGLFDKNPRIYNDAKLLTKVRADDKMLDAMASSDGGEFGTGGMASKLTAARIASNAGAKTIIANAKIDDVLLKIVTGSQVGTLLVPKNVCLRSKSRWLASQIQTKGDLVLDVGAVEALQKGKSLLAIGVVAVGSSFNRGDLVRCLSQSKVEVARGLVNYNSKDCQKLLGVNSKHIEQKLGFVDEPELIHRDNLTLM